MSFKRTSCVLHEQTMMNSEPNVCDVVCLGPPNSEEENVHPSDTKDDILVATFDPCFSPNTTDDQFTSFHCSSPTPQPPSDESTFASVKEVGPLQKLVARDVSGFALKKTETFQDKQLLASRESGCTNIDLRSERNFGTGIEDVKKNVQNNCDRCCELQRISETNYAKIAELSKKLNELTEKHKMFIVSNCELNEENDGLRLQSQQLKLQIGQLTFENSQLRSENENLLKEFAAKEKQWLERSGGSSSSSCPLNADPSHPNPPNQCESVSSVIRDDLQEAILLSYQQKSDVRSLQMKITHQNELIKTLCSQLQRMKGLGKPSSFNQQHQGVNSACVPQQERSPSALQKQLVSNRLSAAVTRQDDATLVSQVGNVEDVLRAKDISNDEDLYSRGIASPSIRSWKKTQQKSPVVTSSTTFQLQDKDVEKQRAHDHLNMGHNIQESSTDWHPTDVQVAAVCVASPTGNTTASAEMPRIQKRLRHTEIVACPFCGQEFMGSSADFQHNFETHIATCTGLGERQCPMCLRTLPDLSQAEFENHVNDHFVPDFEVLAP